jgi:hypothetical protein
MGRSSRLNIFADRADATSATSSKCVLPTIEGRKEMEPVLVESGLIQMGRCYPL